jgi:hypothetical protein
MTRGAYAVHQRAASECPISDVYDLAQDRIAHRPVVQSVHRRDHGHLGRIPRDHPSPTRRQLGEADLEALDKLTVQAEFDGAGTRE